MTVLGNTVLFAALLAAALSAGLYFRSAFRQAGVLKLPRLFLLANVFSLGLASLLLLILILRHDYSIGYVYSYSDNSLPLHYLVSSFYAGQEGSFLFWALCSGLIAIILSRYLRKGALEAPVMAVFMSVQAFLVVLIAARSPFRTLWDYFPNAPAIPPPDGHGLNPLLKNFWMVIHPPVLFVGFAIMAVPFSLAAAGLWKKEFDILPARGFPWVLASAAILGLGIMLGAYWAYGVLGWGGYWGWDPVENSSLLPWLTAVALLHTMLAQLRTGKYVKTNFALAMLSFLLVIYSTFLTRSGILGDASVHAFTDPGAAVYWLLLAGLGVVALVSSCLLVVRLAGLRPDKTDAGFFTREAFLGAGAIALLLCSAVVLFGTSLPIFSKIRVETSFYDLANLPIAIAVGLLIGYSLYTQWAVQDGMQTVKRSLAALGASAFSCAILVGVGVRDPMAVLLIFASVFALVVNVDIGVRVARGDPRFLGGKIAHAGLALFLLGVIATGKFGVKEHASLALNTPGPVMGRVLTYTGYKELPDGKFAFNVHVEGAGESFTLAPVMFANGDQGVMRTPDIASFLTRDFYLSPVSLEEARAVPLRPESLVIEASVKPFIALVWGGTLLMFVGFILAVLKRL